MNTKWEEELGKRIGEIMAHQGVTQPLLSYQTFAKDLKELGQMIEEMAKEYQSRMSETRTELTDKSDMPERDKPCKGKCGRDHNMVCNAIECNMVEYQPHFHHAIS